jgi:hypothetical protein
MENIAWVLVPGTAAGKRIGIVKLNENGYYLTDYDQSSMSEEDAQATVDYMNKKLGVPKEIADSAMDGSMFGWHVPAAQQAVQWFKDRDRETAGIQPSSVQKAIRDSRRLLPAFTVVFEREGSRRQWVRYAATLERATDSAREALAREYPDGNYQLISVTPGGAA